MSSPSSSLPTSAESNPATSSCPATTDDTATATTTNSSTSSSQNSSKRRRLYPMPVSPPLSSSAATAFLSAGCCFGLRRQACLLGALAAFQTVAVVTVILSALSEAGSGVGSRLTPMSIVASSSGDPSGFVDRLNARLGALTFGVPPPSSTGYRPSDELNVTLIEMQSVLYGADCVETFLIHYEQFCNVVMTSDGGGRRKRANGTTDDDEAANVPMTAAVTNERQQQQQSKTLCPCVPRQRLIGRINPLLVANQSLAAETESANYGADPGGHWSPSDCLARQRLAVIVPFRDRETHLKLFLEVIHPMLQRQMVDYTIFVVEQDQPKNIFNKASLMNAGFMEARSMGVRSASGDTIGPFDCYLFHDVDMLPEDDRNFYGCGARLPRHVGAFVDKWNYNLMYERIFGGATSFRPEVFELINGYSNEFYGWGGEDDDILNRIEAKNMTFVRFPKCVATYSMIKHNPDKRNPYNKASVVAWQRRPDQYEQNGLNSLRYKLVAAERRPLYTWLLVTLPPAQA